MTGLESVSHLPDIKQRTRRNEELPPPPNYPAYVQTLLQNAQVLIAHKEYPLAMNLLRNILLRVPNHPDGLKFLGLCYRHKGDLESALKCYRALHKLYPSDANVYSLAETLYLLERDDEAFEFYQDVLTSLESDPARLFEIFKNMGNIHVRSGDYDAAEEYYNRAHTINPHSDVLMVNYGTLEIQRENFESAVARFRTSVEINPNNDKAWVGLALVHRHMGDFDLSWANIERAIDINIRNKTALGLFLEWGAQDHRLTSVAEKLQSYLVLEGSDAEMSFMLARVFTHLNRLQEASLEIERALSLQPDISGGMELRKALRQEIAYRQERV